MNVVFISASLLVMLGLPLTAAAQINVLTHRYDNGRTGANLVERQLTVGNVDASQFGRLYTLPVDGAVYAQPLYASAVPIRGVARDVLYVATMNDKVYAFDASSAATTPLWMRDFTSPPSVTAVPINDIARGGNISGNVGVQGTPVIDAGTRTMYLVARTKEKGSYVQRLHALDITSGAERAGSPVAITATAPGTAPDATIGPGGPIVSFDPRVNIQRAALALTNGVVLVAWASHEDVTPAHGWIIGFDAATLAPVGAMTTAPDSELSGIWQSGRAPAIDAAGHAYFATGNGFWDGVRNFGDSVLKIGVARGGLTLLDYFTPYNEASLDRDDNDLGGSGFTLLPGSNLLLGGGKAGVLYLLDSTNLGKKVDGDAQVPQTMAVRGGHVMGGAVYWRSPGAGPLIYNWSEEDVLKSYRFSGGRITTTPYAQGVPRSPGHPGGSLTISANGSLSGTAIVWASMPWTEDAKRQVAAGIVRAFDAETLQEIWTSEQNPGRDSLGNLIKFVPPVVANGRVYVPNHDNGVLVYGLLAKGITISAAPTARVLPPGSSARFDVTVAPQGGFAGTVALTGTADAAGITASFSPATLTTTGTSTMTVSVPTGFAARAVTVTITAKGAGVSASTRVTVDVSTVAAASGSIGINFTGSGPAVPAAAAAGVVPRANWNNASGAARATPLALVDDDGAAVGAKVVWSSLRNWQTPIASADGNSLLMKGYLDTSATSTTTVTVSGLAARAYDVYVYVDGDNGTATRSGRYSLTPQGGAAQTIVVTDAGSDFAGRFSEGRDTAGNYARFTIAGTGFTLTATPSTASTSTRRAPVNAIQIVPAGSAPLARPIGVDFVGTSASSLRPTDTAGVIPAAHWNNAIGATRSSPLVLVDDSGAASGASATWTANSTWKLPTAADTPDRTMMAGYLDTSSTSRSTVTIAGLAAGTYDVYVYVDGDNRTFTRTADYALTLPAGGTTTVRAVDPASTNFSAGYRQASGTAGNYIVFTMTGTGFTVTGTPTGSTNPTWRAPINALQIVPRAAAAP